jgi:hypothetical protein
MKTLRVRTDPLLPAVRTTYRGSVDYGRRREFRRTSCPARRPGGERSSPRLKARIAGARQRT